MIVAPEWVQAIAALLTLVAITILGVTTYRVQKRMADREEAWNVRPDLTFKTMKIGPSESNTEDTAWIWVKNIGNGPAYDVELSVALPTWDGRSYSILPFDKVIEDTPQHFDTRIKRTDLLQESGDTFKLVVWGKMKDGDGREILVRKERVSYKEDLESSQRAKDVLDRE